MAFRITKNTMLTAAARFNSGSRLRAEVQDAAYQEMKTELIEMKRRTPVWNPARPVPANHVPGSLRASGKVVKQEIEGNRVGVTVSFGDETVDYAVYVHEDMEAHHAIGQAKFVSSVLNESATHMASRIASRVDLKKAFK